MKDFLFNLYYNITTWSTSSDATSGLETAAEELKDTIKTVFEILTPIVSILIGAFIVFKMVTIGLKIAKSSDEPEERSRYIKALIWWGFGLLICVLAATLVPSLLATLMPSN